LVFAVVVGLRIGQASVQASGRRKALEEQLQWFQGVQKENVKLTKENERAAQDNRDRAERKFTELRQAMATKYRVDPRHPATPVEAVRSLQEEIRAMNRTLETAQPPVDFSQCGYLSFQARAASRDLPAMEDVPKIFRQLRLVQEITRIVAQSHLQRLLSLERPMDLTLIEDDLYTATPIVMTVSGTAEQVQDFINKMTTEANYLFFLRTLSIETTDQAPNGALGAAGPATGAGQAGAGAMGPGMEGAGMMNPGMPAGGMMEPGGFPTPGGATPAFRPARPRRSSARDAGAARPPGAMGPGGMPGPEGAMGMGGRTTSVPEEPLTRDALRPFALQTPVTAELRFDLIEFNPPEASQ
jgi:hypothetical protein